MSRSLRSLRVSVICFLPSSPDRGRGIEAYIQCSYKPCRHHGRFVDKLLPLGLTQQLLPLADKKLLALKFEETQTAGAAGAAGATGATGATAKDTFQPIAREQATEVRALSNCQVFQARQRSSQTRTIATPKTAQVQPQILIFEQSRRSPLMTTASS